MKKILSILSIFLLLNNIFLYSVFAATQIELSFFQIKINDGNNYSGDVEVYPGDKLAFLLSGQNIGDAISNPKLEFNFSTINFSYDPTNLKTYGQGVVTNENISTSIFNPGILNNLPLSDSAASGDYLDAYYIDIFINQDTPDNLIIVNSVLSSDISSSNQLSRNIYINSNPHITDYYFEKSGVITTQLTRGGGDLIDLIIKVKDYNGCSNIDNAVVTADLSKLGLTSSETLIFESCVGNIANYKKSGISTIILPDTVNFSYLDFHSIDESGNSNKPDDSYTTFDNEDKKTNLNLEIVSAGTPSPTLITVDDYIGGISNTNTNIDFNGDQNGNYKIILGSDSICSTGTILTDWTTYLAGNTESYMLNSSILIEGNNTLTACLKNDENLIGSFNLDITKDTMQPSIFAVSVGPANVVLDDSDINFTCSENGIFKVEKGGDGTLGSGVEIGSGVVVSNISNTFTITNSVIDVNDNDFYTYCLDEAENNISKKVTVSKTTIPPSFVGGITGFGDNDFDFDGLDGRDISISWDNNIGINYDFFESYRLYVLPSNIDINTDVHTYLGLVSDVNVSSFTGSNTIIKDSLGNDFLSGSNYKACISIMGNNGFLGEAGCSNLGVLTADIVNHATVTSAKFINSVNLEITTDVNLDSNIANHDATLISYSIDTNTFTGVSVSSVVGNKINITIPAISGTSVSGSNLLLGTGALRAEGGGFSDNQSFATIIDGQVPLIYNFANNTSSIYNNFYTGSINISYAFSEDMKITDTVFEMTRISGNPDSINHKINVLGDNLLLGNHSQDIDLTTLNLINGTTYQIRLVGKDLAGNYSETSYITNIGYDIVGPDIVTQNVTNLYSTLTPELTWNIPLDNDGNGSGIKEYKIEIFNGNSCSGTLNQTHTVNVNSKIINSVSDIADYSWKVVAIDNMGNIGITSVCNDFTVNTTTPVFTNFEIKDIVLDSTSFIKQANDIEIISTITDTDINHIWLDISSITGDLANNNELCSSPSVGISCSYVGNIVTYTFTAGSILIDGTKQVNFTAQNVSGGNNVEQIISTTSDSNSPVIDLGAILTPTGIIGGTGTTVTWDTLKINDSIGIDYLAIEYTTGTGSWFLIGTGANIGTIDWNLSTLTSGIDYKVKITAFDQVGNSSNIESGVFELDRTNPIVPSDTLIFPNGGEIVGSNGILNILWNSGSISDTSLKTNPISTFYSIDGGNTWDLIESNLVNSGNYIWNYGNINSGTALFKITAFDVVGNFSDDISDSTFIIDTTKPVLSLNFDSTPVNGNFINNSGFDILGNTSDSNFESFSYTFLNLTTGNYFNGTSFTGSSEILNNICNDPIVFGTNNSCDLINFNLLSSITDGNDYRLQLKSVDEAGNETFSIPVDYIGDTTNPNISITTGSGTFFKDSINISGTSSDLGSGISSVKIQIKKGSDYWDGSSFVTSIQTLNTSTSDNFINWNYDFIYNGDDGEYEIIAIAYDKSFKVNNTSEISILVNKDTTIPEIVGGTSLFTSPLTGDIYIGGTNINILWNTGSIIDSGAGLKANSISLEYFDGTDWNTIVNDKVNNGSYIWNSELLDSNNIKIRLSAIDNVGNIASQSSDSFIIDSTDPIIASIETMDLNADGEIDALNVIMSENIKDSSIVLSDFNISDGIGIPTSLETGNSVNDSTFILKFTDYGDTAFKPSLSYVKGNLVDIAGKYLATDTYTLSIDKASPRLLNSELLDTDSNGKFDKIIATFSENISTTTDASVWDIVNALNGLTINSVSISGNSAHILLNESLDFDTSVGAMGLNFNSNSNWIDSNNNQAGSITDGIIVDNAKPVAYNAEYYDNDLDSKADSVDISFSENLLNFLDTDFNITGLNKNIGTLSNNIISFSLNETILDNDTGVIANFSFTSGNLKDSSNNIVDNIFNKNITDKIKPKLLDIKTNDNNGNAKIDSIVLTYSESLNSDFTTFIGEVDSYIISSYAKGGDNEIIINVDEKSNFNSSDTPLVQLLSNSNLTDINGNIIDIFTYQTSNDGVGPVIIGARYDDIVHKIFLQTSEDFENSEFISSNFVLNNAGSYSIIGTDFAEKSITLTGETISYGSTEISFLANSIGDTLGNKQASEYFTRISSPIVINEIMLSDSSVNNYVELRNLSSSSIDISNYTIGGITVPNGTTITASGYFLITKDTDINSILNVTPDLVDINLNITGTELVLNDGIIDIDFASLTTGLFDTVTPKSIERKDNTGDGLISSNWYTAQDSIGFDNTSSYGTPGIANIYDPIAPTISTYTPTDNNLLANGNFTVSFDYSDNVGGIGVDIGTDTLSISKWDGSVWGSDISGTYVNFSGKVITSTNSNYSVSSLEFGKYKINFSISDKAGNIVTKTIIIYIDNFSFNINTNFIDIGNLTSGFNTFATNEVILTIETVGAGFQLDMNKNGLLTNNGTDIIDFDGNYGFGYDQDNGGYAGVLTSIGNSVNIVNKNTDINTDGFKNIYTYRLKYGAKIDTIQGAGFYKIVPQFNITPQY